MVYIILVHPGNASAVHASGVLFLPDPLQERIMLGDFQRLQKYRREVLRVEALSNAELAAIAAVEPPAWTQRLDHELDSDDRPSC